nr:conjugative transfer relaxase/helicase TraI domain-containing protein [Enterobacter kobei]
MSQLSFESLFLSDQAEALPRASAPARMLSPAEARREFASVFRQTAKHMRRSEVFRDFIQLAASQLDVARLRTPEGMESNYLICKRYEPSDLDAMNQLFCLLVEGLAGETHDFLGALYMEQELGADEMGQYFSPSSISRLMAGLLMPGAQETIKREGWMTLDEKAIKVPVLDKITHTRHEFNKTEAWEAGMVVKRGDRYQDVVAVDRNGRTVTVRDEEGKIALISPKELITGDVQLFRRSEMEVRSGDLLKFTATDREQGQMANQRYTVESVSEEGNIRLKGENGRVTINPEKVRAQQHIDYGWAVTGYGAQGASSDYVIALEGTKDGRKALASRRAFYISASRVKEHVQIYTDGKADWVKAVKTPERDIKTAHDALAPETQRKQAKAIWAMGQPVNKTAIGRAWVRHQGMQDASLTAKIIPATRRFPEPALALPVYDNNGRSAGLALVSLVSSPEGRMTQGETRMVMTERARGAVLQRSQSGNTIVASDLTAALDAVRNHPKDGVVWQTGDEPPSAWLLKVSGGTKQDVSPGIVSTLTDEQNVQQLREQMLADQVRNEEAGRSRQPESLLAEVPQEELIRLKPEDINPRKPEPLNPDADVIARVRGEENTDGQEIKAAAGVRSELEGADKTAGEQSRASRVIADLANAERDMLRAAENTERGRMPEREEQTLTRTIQKER